MAKNTEISLRNKVIYSIYVRLITTYVFSTALFLPFQPRSAQ